MQDQACNQTPFSKSRDDSGMSGVHLIAPHAGMHEPAALGGRGAAPTPTLDRIEAALSNRQEVTAEDLGAAGNELFEYWTKSFDMKDPVNSAYKLCGLQPGGNHTQQDIDSRYDFHFSRIVVLYNAYVASQFIDLNNKENMVGQRFVRMLEVAKSTRNIIMSVERAHRASDLAIAESEMAVNTFRGHLVERDEDITPYQSLLLFLLNEAYQGAYRKLDCYIYRQIMTRDGLPSRAWEQVMEIRQFVSRAVKKEENFSMWKNLTSGRDNIMASSAYLKDSCDLELPSLIVDRHLFSFRSGVLDANAQRFYPHVVPAAAGAGNEDPTPRLDASRAAVRHFDVDLDYATLESYPDWRDIPTPSLHSILAYQKLPPEAIDWAYIMMGRMLYAAGDKDNWQVCPFFKGRASTGKSTICRVIHTIYGEHTGILSNNIEGKFGLYPFKDKLATVCFEVKDNFGLDQGEWQSMVSVEPMSIPVKNKPAIDNFIWKSHMMFAGNEMPGWSDNAGSIARRFIPFLFKEKVHKIATDMQDRLRAEVGNILVKINRAYREAAIAVVAKDEGLWNVLPDYFKKTQRHIVAASQPLVAFLSETETLLTGSDLYMPLADFKSAHAQFITTNGLKRKGWNEDYYKTAFEEWSITIEENTRRAWNGEEVVKNWVVGVGLRPVNSGAVGESGGGSASTAAAVGGAAAAGGAGSGAASAAARHAEPGNYRDDYDFGPDL
jgi:hypothetical protein